MATDEQSFFDSLDSPVEKKFDQKEWSFFQSLEPEHWKYPHQSTPEAPGRIGGIVNSLFGGANDFSRDMIGNNLMIGRALAREIAPGFVEHVEGKTFAGALSGVPVSPLFGSKPGAPNFIEELRSEQSRQSQFFPGSEEGKKTYSAQWFAENLARMAVPLSGQVAVGAATGPAGYAAMGFAQAAGGQYEQAYERKRSQGLSEEKASADAAKEAIAVGAVVAATDAISFGAVMGKLKTKKGIREILNKTPVRRILKGGAVEGGQEGFQEFLTLGIESISDLENYMTSENFQQRVLPSIALGTAAGTAVRGGVELGGYATDTPTVSPPSGYKYGLTPEDATRLVAEDPEAAAEIVKSSRAGVNDFAKYGVERGDGNRKEASAQRKKFQQEVQKQLELRGEASATANAETTVPDQTQTDVPQADTQAVEAQQVPQEQTQPTAADVYLARRAAKFLDKSDTDKTVADKELRTLDRLMNDPAGLKEEIQASKKKGLNKQAMLDKIDTFIEQRGQADVQPEVQPEVAQQQEASTQQDATQQQPGEIGMLPSGMGAQIKVRTGERRLTQSIMRFVKKWSTSLGLSHKDVRRFDELKAANLNRHKLAAEQEYLNYLNAVKKEYGKPLKELGPIKNITVLKTLDPKIKEELNRVINDKEVMYSDDPTSLTTIPESILIPLRAFRREIDSFSRELIDLGVLSEEMEVVVGDNIGEYTVRSYQMWDDPSYGVHKIPKDVLDDAVAWFQENLAEGMPRERQYIINLIDTYFRSKGQKNIKLQGPPGRNDFTSLTKRKDIPKELRKLMGEHTDPGFNAVRTMVKLSYMIETAKFQKNIRSALEGKFLFSLDDPNLPPGMEPLGSSNTLGELANYVADPGIAEAIRGSLEASERVHNVVFRFLSGGSAVSKLMATKYSPASGGRNLISGLNFMVKNGIFEPIRAGKAFWKSLKFHYSDWGKELKGKALEDHVFEKAKEYQSVVGEEVATNELKYFLKVAASNPEGWVSRFFDIDGALNVAENPAWELTLRGLKKADKIATKFWLTGDTLWKIAQYEVEVDRLRSYRKDLSEQEIRDTAAEMVKENTPTYSRVYQWVQWLRKNPLIAPFPSFAAEMYRNNINISKQGISELRYAAKDIVDSGVTNPAEFMVALVKHPAAYVGVSRLVGLATGLGLGAAGINLITKWMTGVSDEEEKALGELDPEWAKGNWWAYPVSEPRDEDGYINRFDISYIHTDNAILKPWVALMRTKDPAEFMNQLVDPFTGSDIFYDAFSEINQNYDSERNRKIYNEDLYKSWVNPDTALHLGEAVTPGLAKTAVQGYEAWTGKVRPDAKKVDVSQAIASALGFKQYSHDPTMQIPYAARDYKTRDSDTRGEFQGPARSSGDVSTEELTDLYVRMEKARLNNFREMERKFNAAIVLSDRNAVLKATKEPLSDNDQRRLLSGMFEEYVPSPRFLDSVPKRKKAQVLEAIRLGKQRIESQKAEARQQQERLGLQPN